MGDASAPKDKGGKTRLIVLVLALIVMLGALGWDYKVARPQSELKANELAAAAQQRGRTSKKPQLSTDEVAEVLARKPSKKLDDHDNYLIEVFKWRSGLPWRSYDVWVVYRKTSVGPQFHTLTYLEEPEENMLPGHIPEKPLDLPEDEQDGVAPAPVPMTGFEGLEGGATGGEGRGRGGPPPPDAPYNTPPPPDTPPPDASQPENPAR